MSVALGRQRLRAAGWLQARHETTQALSTWVLTLALVLYLAFNSGGYAYPVATYMPTAAEVGIVVWWIVAICAAWGLLPSIRPAGSARASILLFGGFTAWTALGVTWSISRGRSFDDLALVSCYLGILVLAVQIHRERGEALRRTVAAVATAIVIIAVIAVASRLWPHLFSGSQISKTAAKRLGGSSARLAWPIGYWNGLAALMAIGLPLLLGLATSAHACWARSAAAAAVPVLALCAALTQSRGALVEAAVGVAVFIALAPQRATKLVTYAITACGGALLVDYGLHRHAIKYNLGGSHSHQAWMVALATVVVCACVALVHAGADRVLARITLPRLLSPTQRQARIALAAAVMLLIVLGLAAHGPAHISHAWNSFKSASGANTTNHFASSGGEGRYQFWVAGIDSAKSHPFTGSGPGTFQLDWLPRATIPTYTVNAHSLYVETYTELGLVGFLLLSAFLVTALVVLIRQAIRSRDVDRVRAAAAAAALTAFVVGAAIDWLWQLPAAVAVVLLLVGAGVAPRSEVVLQAADSRPASPAMRTRRQVRAWQVRAWRVRAWQVRAATVLVGLACIFAAAYPLDADQAIASSQAITSSKHATSSVDMATAISHARHAVAVEPDSAAAQQQLAVSLGDAGKYRAAVAAARAATIAEPQGWSNWYVLGQLYADLGRGSAAKSAYTRAHSLNPQSYP
jgi:hypothetical protein